MHGLLSHYPLLRRRELELPKEIHCVSLLIIKIYFGTISRGKVAFVYSGTVLRYYIDQTFLATFRSDLDLGVVWLVEVCGHRFGQLLCCDVGLVAGHSS